MKIKRERQVRLDGLIDYVWKNKTRGIYYDQFGYAAVFNNLGHLRLDLDISYNSIFTITEEVEITEEMELKQLVVIYENGGSGKIRNINIKELVERHESVYGHGVPIKFIYLQNEDGSIGELIWSKRSVD